ncbi:polymorphic toxin type 43 domain-containing protein [Nocardia sp. NPDC006630]|uniref:polymorphic toxin type 43 domain-containing protein n=1 Tax=Nocardia sp. NPDC006630 TaxID=3157181 RepID=UPI00339E2B4A
MWSDPLGLTPDGCKQEGEKLHGSGPAPGAIEASDRVKSFAALHNYHPSHGVEFVFDPNNGRFAVGEIAPYERSGIDGSPHEKLARSIGADPSSVVGGMFWNDVGDCMRTNEASGHFWQNWNGDVRAQFIETMKGYGFDVFHHGGK